MTQAFGTIQVVVLPAPAPPLTLESSILPTTGTAPLSVSFGEQASGGVPPYKYGWSFGDGGLATIQAGTYTYQNVGTFLAVGSVTDST